MAAIEPRGVICHCSMCRTISGSGASPVVLVKRNAFEIVRGDALSAYRSSSNTDRWHCAHCHSPIYADVFDRPDLPLFVPAGLFETLDVAFEHIFTASAASWDAICDDRPRHADAPPKDLLC